MEAKPVRDCGRPAYPTRREVLAGAASFALFSLTGCGVSSWKPEKGKIVVAPIFEHGEGRGAEGCVVISPPVFLSEEEAMQVVREELAKQGIQLKAGGTVEAVRIPSRTLTFETVKKDGKEEYEKRTVVVPGQATPLKLDGFDSAKAIQVVFISEKDVDDLGGPFSIGTVDCYDLKEDAKYVAEHMAKLDNGRVFFGVFYDPLCEASKGKPTKADERLDWKSEWEERKKRSKEESLKQLRRQAQDFVGWLKEQKAIE
jgi:hypothetical protein